MTDVFESLRTFGTGFGRRRSSPCAPLLGVDACKLTCINEKGRARRAPGELVALSRPESHLRDAIIIYFCRQSSNCCVILSEQNTRRPFRHAHAAPPSPCLPLSSFVAAQGTAADRNNHGINEAWPEWRRRTGDSDLLAFGSGGRPREKKRARDYSWRWAGSARACTCRRVHIQCPEGNRLRRPSVDPIWRRVLHFWLRRRRPCNPAALLDSHAPATLRPGPPAHC